MADGTLTLTTWEIPAADGGPAIRGDLRVVTGSDPREAVVICHGFKGFRRWGFFPALARAAARRGFAAVTFDFSRNGVGPDGVDFSALDAFAQNTHSRNVDEIRTVLDGLQGERLLARPPRRVGLLGHSRGGAEALIAASEDSRVDALATWASIADIPSRWPRETTDRWRAGDTVAIQNARTGQEMPIAPEYWRDIEMSSERLDVLRAAASLDIPWLIVHGESDESVPVEDASRLFTAAGEDAELLIIEGTGHTFDAVHPFTGPTPALSAASDATLGWLAERLR